MASISGLYPIFEKNRVPASASWDLTELENHIRERDHIEFLANKSINQPNAERLYLEPIPLELWEPLLSKSDNEMKDATPANEDRLELLSVGRFEFLYESDEEVEEPPKVPSALLNISEYQKRREQQRLFQLVPPNSFLSTTSGIQPVVDSNDTQTTIEHALTSGEQPNSDLTSTTVPSIDSVMRQSAATTLFANLYDDSLMDTTKLSERPGTKIYAYPENIIPIFATPAQQNECDQHLKNDSRFHKVNFQNSVQTLSFPVSGDIAESGKGLFIKNLLTNLQDRNLTLALVTAGFNDECSLSDGIKQLGLRCDRFSNIFRDWEADYGVYVETKPLESSGSLQRKFNQADFVICTGATIDSGTIKRLQSTPQTPVAWMITVGSIEQRVSEFSDQHQRGYPEITNLGEFEELLKVANKWPVYDHYTFQELTSRVANHVSGWLNLSGKSAYQFRSIEQLPLSYHYASFKVQAEEDVEDMDISSDNEDTQAVRQVFDHEIFPIYEIIRKSPTTAVVPQAILDSYEREAQLLKEKYDAEYKGLLDKYRAKVAESN
ncbi:hypothetical protein [Parasitella parasitica]|uniref:Uncharacterized protein n=1 Tax=Parasitella parasitica TaxID=35722 RepID=A0A0B7N075_9FUNG|nr:hypothetical protein [Parasitella parasitica]